MPSNLQTKNDSLASTESAVTQKTGRAMFIRRLIRQEFRGKHGAIVAKRSVSKKYSAAYKESFHRREQFWAKAAEELTWFKKWEKVIDNTNPPFTRWFVGGEFSHCYNALDRHVREGRGSQVAIIHDSPVTNSVSKMKYDDLLREVSLFAGVLSSHGVEKGDRVMIYMPMIPQVIISMLAVLRLGAIHAVVFGGFAAKELSARISSCKPKVIICANYGIEPNRVIEYKPMVDDAIDMADHKPLKTIVFQRPNMQPAKLNGVADLNWDEEMSRSRGHDCVPVDSNHPMYLLYTSGTTGLPKAVMRPTAGHSVVLNWTVPNVYGMKPREVFWTAADMGWSAGHSYACHGPLLHGNTTILYEGKPVGTPDSSSFFRIINDHRPACVFTAPTAFRAIKREDPNGTMGDNYDLSSLRSIFVGGERSDADSMEWIAKTFKTKVFDHWWQTETGHPITATCIGLDCPLNPPRGTAGVPVPGWDVQVVNEDGSLVKPGVLGNIVVQLPLNPGSLLTIWDDDERFVDTYFRKYPGYYDTMDSGSIDENRYLSVISRTDGVINVAGHRLSCGHIEEVICAHDAILECAVVAKKDKIKGTIPFAYVVMNTDFDRDMRTVFQELVESVRENIGPVAAFKEGVFVNHLPKTRSGKIPRKTLEALINKQPYKIAPTIEDESVYPQLEKILRNGTLSF